MFTVLLRIPKESQRANFFLLLLSLPTGRVKESERQREKKKKKEEERQNFPLRPSRWCLASNYSNVSDGSFDIAYVLKGEYEKGF